MTHVANLLQLKRWFFEKKKTDEVDLWWIRLKKKIRKHKYTLAV